MKCNGNSRQFSSIIPALAGLILLGLTSHSIAEPGKSPRQALLDQYCVSCHNQAAKTAGLDLENARSESPAAHPELWEKVIRRVNVGEMPPAGMPRPNAASLKVLTSGLASDLDTAAKLDPYAGRPVI